MVPTVIDILEEWTSTAKNSDLKTSSSMASTVFNASKAAAHRPVRVAVVTSLARR